MTRSSKFFKSIEELKVHIKSSKKTIYVGAKTSTVLPFESLPREMIVGNLACLPKSMALIQDKLTVKGPVSIKEARSYLRGHGRDLYLWPTDQEAFLLSGLATSATGERSFAYGSQRDQVESIEYMGYEGQLQTLSSEKPIASLANISPELLQKYQESCSYYSGFKNGPFPFLENECDLMIGSEGQLGVITSATFKTNSLKKTAIYFIKLPRWEQSIDPHLEVLFKVQKYRRKVLTVELLDSNCLSLLENHSFKPHSDYLFLEIDDSGIDQITSELFAKLENISIEDVGVISHSNFEKLRTSMPRFINEHLSREKSLKKGTDVQVKLEYFAELIESYRKFSKAKVPYFLFGHFGDCHLHFNFLPKPDQMEIVEVLLEDFYRQLPIKKCSPFAEHGIGIIKKKFVDRYYNEVQKKVFKGLKDNFDPGGIFFPNGFMGQEID